MGDKEDCVSDVCVNGEDRTLVLLAAKGYGANHIAELP